MIASYYSKIGGVEVNARRPANGCAEAGDQVTLRTLQLADSPAEEWMDSVYALRFPLTMKVGNYQTSLTLFRYPKQNAAEFNLFYVHSYHMLKENATIRIHPPFAFTPYYHGTEYSPSRVIPRQTYRPVRVRQFTATDATICNSNDERGLLLGNSYPKRPSCQFDAAAVIPEVVQMCESVVDMYR